MTSRRNDRLAPPLMHAFRAAHRERDAALPVDIREQGERVLAPRRVTTRAPITEAELRRLVGSDISALLNTINLASAEDLTDAPEVRKSILNFGFPDLTGISIAENRVFGVAKLLETALRDFEPRLAPG
jgi:type VI secretion system protein ImpF